MLKAAVLFCYPWDFRDEGIDDLVHRARDLGITHLAVAASYHAGFFFHPHNPKQHVHLLEDGVIYFHPDDSCFADGPIRPTVATMSRQRDWIGEICQSTCSAGMQPIAWTVLLHNTRIGLAYPEATIHNVFGDSYPHALSPAHPASMALAQGLVRNLAARYPFESIFLEAPNYRQRAHGGSWVSGHHHERCGIHLRQLEIELMDLSFNPADVEQAKSAGVDVEALRSAVQDHLARYFAEAPDVPDNLSETIDQFRDEHPVLVDYVSHFRRAERVLLATLREQASRHDVTLIGSSDPSIDIVMAGAYGKSRNQVEEITRSARNTLQPPQELMVALRMGFYGPGMGDAIVTRQQMIDITRTVAEGGADRIAYYNYAEAPIRCVNWIKPELSSEIMA